MIDSCTPFMYRRLALGLTLADLQLRLAAHGFNYSMEFLQAIERGERRFPENPGFVVAIARSLDMPVTHVQQTAHQTTHTLVAHRTFQNKVNHLKPQNKFLLRFILRHPTLTLLPGFDTAFEMIKSLVLLLPDQWFDQD